MTPTNDYCPSSMPLDTRIAADKTVSDWLALRAALISDPSNTSKWKEAYDFFRLRIDTRFIRPIECILGIGQKQGEGHYASALQCILVEFLEALFQGKVYRQPLSPDAIASKAADLGVSAEDLRHHTQPHEYTASAILFRSFLTTHEPFSNVFTSDDADTFYKDVRCGLLHEAATKAKSVVRAERADNPGLLKEVRANGLVVYRNALQKALVEWIDTYGQRLLMDHDLQQNFLRKMDDIAQVRRCFCFAYGGNLKRSHLLSRIPHIHSSRKARLDGYEFRYNKRSNDGTAKANISRSAKTVWGMCYEIDECDFRRLHRLFEKGYDTINVWTKCDQEKAIIAKTFVSKSLTTASPSPEYVERLVRGAKDHQLPGNYIKEYLEQQ